MTTTWLAEHIRPLPTDFLHVHFVPEGFEETDRGICICGELVSWSNQRERWEPDPELRVLVFRPGEIPAPAWHHIRWNLGVQVEVQDEWTRRIEEEA